MEKTYILETMDLEKRYDETLALAKTNLKIEKGKVYGLIGRNGAGKTTLLKLMNDMLFPTKGKVKWNQNIILKKGDIAFGRAYNIKYFNQKISDILEVASYAFPNWNQDYADTLIENFELDTKKAYPKVSSGMQTMTSLVIALSANPKLLLLDEPYVGLDPINREFFYSFLREHFFDGEKTVIISSHMIKEIEGYFEKTIILKKGQVLIDEDLDDIKQKSLMINIDKSGESFLQNNFNILGKDELAGRITYYIYNQINDSQIRKIESLGGQIQSMDLQTFMIKLLTKEGQK